MQTTFLRITSIYSKFSLRWVYWSFTFLGVGWDWVYLVRRPLFGLLYQPRMTDEDECGAVGKKSGRGIRMPLWPPQIPHDLTVTRIRAAGKSATNRLSYGTTLICHTDLMSALLFKTSTQSHCTHFLIRDWPWKRNRLLLDRPLLAPEHRTTVKFVQPMKPISREREFLFWDFSERSVTFLKVTSVIWRVIVPGSDVYILTGYQSKTDSYWTMNMNGIHTTVHALAKYTYTQIYTSTPPCVFMA
jgi:hypothetical protein